jgi:predicted MPP superfamily phosphohydrolase
MRSRCVHFWTIEPLIVSGGTAVLPPDTRFFAKPFVPEDRVAAVLN